MISNKEDIARLVNDWGFLPFFVGEVRGFSLAEVTPPELWFPEDDTSDNGVWDWKSDIILEADCAYGKFYCGRACFVSMDCFPDLVNCRRAAVRLTVQERRILDVLKANHSLLSGELKKLCGYLKPRIPRSANRISRIAEKQAGHPGSKTQRGEKRKVEGFETALTHLQMGGFVVSAAFEYKYDREGKRYGWGMARYATPEDFFGAERLCVNRSPEASYDRLVRSIARIPLPFTSDQVQRLILG